MTNLQKRILSSVILIPLIMGLIYAGPPYSTSLGIVVTIALLFEWILMSFRNRKPSFWGVLIFILGLFYILGASLLLISLLNTSGSNGAILLLMLLLIVWATDTGAYAVGSWLRGPKLAPSISPQKTWSGVLGGIFFGTLLGGAVVHFLGQTSEWMTFLPMVAGISLVGQLGDLLESTTKRYWRVKDSGALIPGHGGLLDRLDSLLGIAFVLAIWQAFM